ncbi:MAG TPA: hypothetical protein VFV94_10085 [Polyangiaceae bacterium]|jgi:hypothetical protein|nr:hypothetical protein [Polyangiaceae bacterium]
MQRLSLLTVLCLAAVVGCSAEPEVESTEPGALAGTEGNLTVAWLVEGGSAALHCSTKQADSVLVLIETANDGIVSDATQACETQRAHFTLESGYYEADVALLDADGALITDAIHLGPMTLLDAPDELVVTADFREFRETSSPKD